MKMFATPIEIWKEQGFLVEPIIVQLIFKTKPPHKPKKSVRKR